jgi:hypothetical protein
MSFPEKLLPPALQPYALLLKVGLVVAILGATWLHGHHRGVTSTEAKHQVELSAAKSARIKQYEDQIVAQQAKAQQLEADSDKLQAQLDQQLGQNHILIDALSRVPLVTHEPNPVPGGAPIVRLTPAVRVCLNAATIGTAGAAADCKAIGVRTAPAP